MLICPQCKSENPDKNKFCQNCGTSLSYKICPQCSSKVALDRNKCDNCGTKTGLVWWAIISKNKQTPISAMPEANSDISTLLTIGLYLDSQQRYQVLEPLPPPAPKEIQCKVLDCQPLQISLLKADTNNTVEIGETARTYLLLYSQLGEVIPKLHDAWELDGRQVLLLSDRSLWRHLLELWQDNNTTALQIDQLLLAMTELWAALIPWNACRSLLELSNLRVNAQGTLALQRLHIEPVSNINNEQATLQELGKVWQHLFGESQRTKVGAMVELLAQMQVGEIHTVEQLQFLLMEIVNQPPILATSSCSPIINKDAISSSSSDLDPSTVIQLDKSSTNVMQTDDTPTIVLPMQLICLEDAGLTDVGGQRQHNEDCFGIETAVNKLEFPRGKNIQARGLYILCDGMGGHAGGEVASSLAVKTLQQYFQANWQSAQLPSEEVIRQAVQLANKVIYDANQQDARSGVGRMGTTLVMVLLQDNQVAVAHVGDSRLYRLNRKIGIEQVTLDHEVGQREILRGVEPSLAYARPDAYQLTQALGPRDENYVNPDVKFLELNEDTLFILASDGLSDNNLVEQHWKSHLDPLLSSGSNLDQGVNALIDLANQYNGHDNITAVLVRAKVAPRHSSQF